MFRNRFRAGIVLALVMVPMFLFAQAPPGGGRRPGGGGGGGRPPFDPNAPVEKVRKNIKVLTGMPNSQLLSTMDYFGASLGVRCGFCHVVDSAGLHPELDENPNKKTAREMIQLVLETNKNHFDGRPQVTCYTCHRGNNDPQNIPKLPVAAAKEVNEDEEMAKMPKVDQVIAMYEKALGGADAIAKVKSRVSKVTLTRDGQESKLEKVQEAPAKYAGTMITPDGNFTNVVSDTTGWMISNEGARPISESEKTRLHREAPLFPLQRLKEISANLHVAGTDTVNGKPAYVLSARLGDNTRERYYIDSVSGLLVRRNVLTKTMLAWIPDQCDYDDYRTVDGVQVPFVQRYFYVNPRSASVHAATSIEQNTKVDEKMFTMPDLKK